jgi:diguanylate cyclase (GGDEF)-like protein
MLLALRSDQTETRYPQVVAAGLLGLALGAAFVGLWLALGAGSVAQVGLGAGVALLAGTALLGSLRRTRRFAQVALRRERWLRALVLEATDALLVLDSHDQLLYVSDSAEAMFGVHDQASLRRAVGALGQAVSDRVRSEYERVRSGAAETGAEVVDVIQGEERSFQVGRGALREVGGEADPAGEADDDFDLALAALDTDLDGESAGTLRLHDRRRRQLRIAFHNRLQDPDLRGMVVRVTDITVAAALSEELTERALHDPLTGLANRALFTDRLVNAVARQARRDGLLAVVCLDLDNFKAINDSLGHVAGDSLLAIIGSRLTAVVRGGDTAARLGGDEFALILEQGVDEADIQRAVARVSEEVGRPCLLGGQVVRVGASMGVGLLADEPLTPEDLLRRADMALFDAKSHGAMARTVIFDASRHDAVQSRQALRTDLTSALGNGELLLLYQPIIHMATGEVTDVEALMRWAHPRRGMISPLEFIPIAEESELIVDMGRWALQRACRDIAVINRGRGKGRIGVHVNVSARQLAAPGLVDDVRTALAEHHLSPRVLLAEMTESVLMDDVTAAQARLTELRDLGVRVGLDDFGTGYSSLGYLKDFPLDVVKIDRAFVTSLATDANDRILAAAIINLCHELRFTTVAEGIETEAQAGLLRQLGCDRAQGFLFARPLPLARLLEFLADEVRLQERLRLAQRELPVTGSDAEPRAEAGAGVSLR